MSGSVIVAGARTPMGRLLGSLKDFSAADLGGIAIAGALEKAGVSPDQVDYVIMGQVIQAGAGQNPARQAAVKAGIPMDVPSITINKVCLTGINAIALADQLIRAGEYDVVVAGGMESMTQGPHMLPKSRSGFKYGDVSLVDSTSYDALTDAFDQIAMGVSTEGYNSKYDLTREQQDAFAAESVRRAQAAVASGVFAGEIVPVTVKGRKGETVVASGRSTPPASTVTILASSASTSTRRNSATTVASGPSGSSTVAMLPASDMMDTATGSMR